jgi:hypothetical protein
MRRARWLAAVGVVVIAALLAFPLRGVVHELIVVPLSYLLWLLELVYLSLHQSVWWIGTILVVLFILGRSLLTEIEPPKTTFSLIRSERGKVENLAVSIEKSKKGIYFKWLVANRLGKLAYQILLLREHGKPRSVFAPLTAEGWDITPEIRQYLEKGLHGSFTDFPNSHRSYLSRPVKTQLDHDVVDVIEFLELQQGDSRFPAG